MLEPVLELTEVARMAMQGQGLDPIDAVPHDLVCSICLHPAFGGVTTACEHVFHKACLESALQDHKECPFCRSAIESSGELSFKPIGRVLSNLLGDYKVKCPQGCDFQAPWQSLMKHIESDCPYTLFKCSHDGCRMQAQVRAEAINHMQECEYAMVRCECSQVLKRKDLDSHKASTCTKALVVCEFCNKGGLERGAMEAHLRESCNAFATVSFVKPLQDTIKKLSDQVEALQKQVATSQEQVESLQQALEKQAITSQDKVKLLEMQLMTCQSKFRVKLPQQIRNLPVDEEGEFKAIVCGHLLSIYPKGYSAKDAGSVSVFIGPPTPASMHYDITIGSTTVSVDHKWEEPANWKTVVGSLKRISLVVGFEDTVSINAKKIDPVLVDLSC